MSSFKNFKSFLNESNIYIGKYIVIDDKLTKYINISPKFEKDLTKAIDDFNKLHKNDFDKFVKAGGDKYTSQTYFQNKIVLSFYTLESRVMVSTSQGYSIIDVKFNLDGVNYFNPNREEIKTEVTQIIFDLMKDYNLIKSNKVDDITVERVWSKWGWSLNLEINLSGHPLHKLTQNQFNQMLN